MVGLNAAEAQPRKTRTRVKKPIPDIDKLPASALLNDTQVAALSGFAIITLKVWRRDGRGQGPKLTYIEGWPRYRVGDVREWLSGNTQQK